MVSAFHSEHERIYSHAHRTAEVEFVDLRIRVRGAMATPKPSTPEAAIAGDPVKGVRTLRVQGQSYPEARIYERSRLSADDRVEGPAVIEQPDATIVVPQPMWRAWAPMAQFS
ncbi:hypothetical protein [Variovorax paradoxus]|jgi:N-methylhydantoinase A|uniref:hypothetical protein n=1 Tax=Variovorax paradoxus TaxID=34073 RepID=UPI0006E6E2CA|nr:hypothetical protein APR52_36945 [Variovorax paradoxus]